MFVGEHPTGYIGTERDVYKLGGIHRNWAKSMGTGRFVNEHTTGSIGTGRNP
jgi:hypothetical protein